MFKYFAFLLLLTLPGCGDDCTQMTSMANHIRAKSIHAQRQADKHFELATRYDQAAQAHRENFGVAWSAASQICTGKYCEVK